jgi:thiol-disulfide isomerase/thioredoxin/arginine exporter protein ArgO
MQIPLLAARVLLFGVFSVAGLAKLADRAGTRRALVEFGVSSALASPLAVLLPVVELGIAAAQLPVAAAWYGALGALSLLLIFILGISLNLVRGRTPNCHCFGQLSSAPIGWATVVRNSVLAFVSGFVVWLGRDNPGLSVVSWLGELSLADRVLFIIGAVGLALLAAEGWVLLQILRQQGRLLLRLEAIETHMTSAGLASGSTEDQEPVVGLPVATPAPTFRLKGLGGGRFTLEALLNAGKPVLLFFTNPSCGPCQSLMPDISRWQREYNAALNIVAVSEGTVRDNRAKSAEYGVTQVLLQQKREVADAYLAYGTPSAVLIQTDGTIGSPLAVGADAIQALVTQVLKGIGPPLLGIRQKLQPGNVNGTTQVTSPIQIGQLAPPLKLQGLDGKAITLTSFLGNEVLLLFWNPSCGFCAQMLDDLREWEALSPPGAPTLLVVSSGTMEDNLAMNLRSQVVIDPNSTVGSAFGASGTPMAVLLDAKGRVASELAAGAQAVLALGGR